ncbi:MAG: MerR family transcriptional regulator [Chloroflexi bacterium]|nr:MerR family transcriptional regulator [Chloroflexota bacterium]
MEHSEQRGDGSFYIISVTARMVGVHAQTLRYYDKLGLVQPYRSPGGVRYYSLQQIVWLRRARTLVRDMGVNLAGVEVILRLMERLEKTGGDDVAAAPEQRPAGEEVQGAGGPSGSRRTEG